MCLYIDTSKHEPQKATYTRKRPVPLVAKRDMIVWKIIGWENAALYHYNFKYGANKKYSIKKMNVEFIGDYDGFSIHKGFHAWVNREAARTEFSSWGGGEGGWKIVKFKIPKGSHYFYGLDDDIVSDGIVTGDLKHCR